MANPFKRDRADRPSPPDRDGDGHPGGSLPGNETVEEALGTAEEALAEEQTEHDGLATIIIPAHETGVRSRPSVSVNGRQRHLDVGVEVKVDAAELAVLETSHVDFKVVVPLPASDEAAGVEGSSSAAETAEELTQDSDTDSGSGEPAETQPEGEATVTQPEGETPAE